MAAHEANLIVREYKGFPRYTKQSLLTYASM